MADQRTNIFPFQKVDQIRKFYDDRGFRDFRHGITGALLWGAVMALLSLLPAVGAAIVWAPVAIYLLATGSVWAGIGLVAWGTFVIGLVDNVLRPILVGKETRMPDWLVLVATLGGLAVFGLAGFVIGPVIAAIFIAAWAIFSEEKG
jgi:predicted PurR-regulated permease PerM